MDRLANASTSLQSFYINRIVSGFVEDFEHEMSRCPLFLQSFISTSK